MAEARFSTLSQRLCRKRPSTARSPTSEPLASTCTTPQPHHQGSADPTSSPGKRRGAPTSSPPLLSLARNTPPASPTPDRHHPERPKPVASSHGHRRPRPQPAMATDRPQHNRANHGLPRPTSYHVGRIQPATLHTCTGRRRRISTPATATAGAVRASCSCRRRTQCRLPPHPTHRCTLQTRGHRIRPGQHWIREHQPPPPRVRPTPMSISWETGRSRPPRTTREEERSHAATIPTGRARCR
jgi:hypothetical protein